MCKTRKSNRSLLVQIIALSKRNFNQCTCFILQVSIMQTMQRTTNISTNPRLHDERCYYVWYACFSRNVLKEWWWLLECMILRVSGGGTGVANRVVRLGLEFSVSPAEVEVYKGGYRLDLEPTSLIFISSLKVELTSTVRALLKAWEMLSPMWTRLYLYRALLRKVWRTRMLRRCSLLWARGYFANVRNRLDLNHVGQVWGSFPW